MPSHACTPKIVCGAIPPCLFAGLMLSTGCSTLDSRLALPYDDEAQSELSAPDSVVQAVRQSRYTLIELRPEPGQADLQQQIIDLRIPAITAPTVGDAMRYVLRHSGYQLCSGEPALTSLWSLPLPAAHMQLGPLPLNQVLQLLAGSAWRLSLDERSRQVCFVAASLPGEDWP